jgi:excisionase family DNA binding protein
VTPQAAQAHMNDTILTTEDVLAYLHVNLRTIYRLIKAGRIPAVRVGRQWRFRKAEIDLWLESQGTMTAESSRRTASADADGAAAAESGPSPRPRILVVDDEASIRDLLSKALALADYDVDTAPDGQTALGRLRSGRYDLLITDLKMPGMDGLTLIREARQLTPALPVVIITAYSTEASAIEAINLGVSGYLTKPFRITNVFSTAARALGR